MENINLIKNKNFILTKKYATVKNIFLLFILNLIMLTIILPEASRDIIIGTESNYQPGYSLLYSPSIFYQTMADYGVLGRSRYAFVLLTANLIFPILYSLFLCGLVFQISQHLVFKIPQKLYLLPFILPLLAFIKNLSLVFLLRTFPEKHHMLLRFLALLTSAQWVLLLSFAVLVLTGFVFISKKYVRKYISLKN